MDEFEGPERPPAPLALDAKPSVTEVWVQQCVEAKHKEAEAKLLQQDEAWKKSLAGESRKLRAAAKQDLDAASAPLAEQLIALQRRLEAAEAQMGHMAAVARGPVDHTPRWEESREALEERVVKLEAIWEHSGDRLKALEARCSELEAQQADSDFQLREASLGMPRPVPPSTSATSGKRVADEPQEAEEQEEEKLPVQEEEEEVEAKAPPKAEEDKEAAVEHFVLEYQPESSIWDASILVGVKLHDRHHHITYAVVMVFALLLNIFVQVVFLLIISGASFVAAPIGDGDLERLAAWRRNVGHDVARLDPIEMSSLTSRVCEEDSVVEMAGSQVELLGNIRTYLGKEGLEKIFGGTMMASLAMLVWSMSVCREALCTLHAILSVMTVPRAASTSLVEADDGLELQAVTFWRMFFAVCVQSIRLAIAMVLFWFGSVYLKNIVSVQDLLLNAVALEFILSVDELCFDALVPTLVASVLQKLKPIERRVSTTRIVGPDFLRRGIIFLVALLLIYHVAVALPGIKSDLQKAEQTLCDGRRDFVYTINAAGLVNWLPTYTTGDQADTVRSSYTRNAVQSIIESVDAEPSPASLQATGLRDVRYSITDWSSRSAGEVLSYINPLCEDLLDRQSAFQFMARSMMSAAFGFNVTQCSEVADWCNKEGEESTRTRQYCPQTCGCDDPSSNLIFNKEIHGCPVACRAGRLFKYRRSLIPCQSPNATQLQGNAAWNSLLKGSLTVIAAWTQEAQAQFGKFLEDMESIGCGYVTIMMTQGWDVCSSATDAWPFLALGLICPEECQCQDRGNDPDCPSSC